MNRIPCARLILTAAVLALLVVPMAGARPVESPRPVQGVEIGWFDAALSWLERIPGFRRPTDRPGTSDTQKTSSSTQGGSCIDPVGGRPRPCDQ